MGAEKLEKVETKETTNEKKVVNEIQDADPKSVAVAVEKNGSFAKAKEASPGPKPAPEKKEKQQEKTEKEKKEELQQKATDLILSEIKKYGFEGTIKDDGEDKPVSDVIFEKLKKKYDKTINGYNKTETSEKYKKINSPKIIFGKDLQDDMTEIIADYNRIIILNEFNKQITDTDETTKKLIKNMLEETSDSDINALGLALNMGEKKKIVGDLLTKIDKRNKEHPKNPLIRFYGGGVKINDFTQGNTNIGGNFPQDENFKYIANLASGKDYPLSILDNLDALDVNKITFNINTMEVKTINTVLNIQVPQGEKSFGEEIKQKLIKDRGQNLYPTDANIVVEEIKDKKNIEINYKGKTSFEGITPTKKVEIQDSTMRVFDFNINKVSSTKDTIVRIQVPEGQKDKGDKIKQKFIKDRGTNPYPTDDNIKVEEISTIKNTVNITYEDDNHYTTGIQDATFEVPVNPDQNIKNRVVFLLQKYPGDNTTITIKIPSTGNGKVVKEIQAIIGKLSKEDQGKIVITPVDGLQNVDISGEVVEYGKITSKVKLPYNKIADKTEIEKSLPPELNDILKDPKCTIIGGEIYGSASYQHTTYTPNEKLETFVNDNESKFSIQNKTVDGKQIKQQSTTDTGSGSVTNNPTLARDRALTFLDYINTLPGANNKKIPNIASIAVAYGVNGPTLEEAMKNIGTEKNVDQRLQSIFEEYQYTTLSLQYKKVKNIETEIFPLTAVATSTEGFHIGILPKDNTTPVKIPRRTGTNNFWGDGTIQIPQGKSKGCIGRY